MMTEEHDLTGRMRRIVCTCPIQRQDVPRRSRIIDDDCSMHGKRPCLHVTSCTMDHPHPDCPDHGDGTTTVAIVSGRGPDLLHAMRDLQEPAQSESVMLNERVLRAVQEESARAHRKHLDTSLLSDRPSTTQRLAALMEEVGEVARLLTDDGGCDDGMSRVRPDSTRLIKELIQAGNVSLSWAQWLMEGGHERPTPEEYVERVTKR